MSKLLVVVDYQNDFVSGALANDAAKMLEGALAAKVSSTLKNDDFVLFTLDSHESDYLNTREGRFLPIEHCIKGTYGWEIYGSLAIYQNIETWHVAFLEKPTFGAAEIYASVKELCDGEPDEIELVGVVTDICVISNAILLHTFFPFANIYVNDELCAAATPEGHKRAVDILRGLGM